MTTRDTLLDLIHEGIQHIPLPAEPAGLYRPIEYALESGGKRLRPMLLLAVADALGRQPREVLSQALAIEVFHNFTLLHDDVMDRADVRRGRPTVHCKWDDNTAILSGDAMLTLATQLLADGAGAHLPAILDLFNRTAMEVYEGQQMDMDLEQGLLPDTDIATYMQMIRLKTSVLLACACRMGALLADAAPEVADAFESYGLNLGLAFQLRDDLLDTFGDPTIFGKQIGGDILCGKKTWLMVNARHALPDALRQACTLDGEERITAVTDIFRRLQLDTLCQREIDRLVDSAVAALPDVLTPAERTFFTDLALSTRTRVN